MKIGYARVSTADQDLQIQRQKLKEAWCEILFEEKVSGAKRNRPELGNLLKSLRAEDVVVVTRLDRLARSTMELLRITDELSKKGTGIQSLEEPWADTTSAAGRMVLTVFAGIAEFERDLIRSRTSEGREAAKARGVPFGRPKKLRQDQQKIALQLIEGGSLSVMRRGLLMSTRQQSTDAWRLKRPYDSTPFLTHVQAWIKKHQIKKQNS